MSGPRRSRPQQRLNLLFPVVVLDLADRLETDRSRRHIIDPSQRHPCLLLSFDMWRAEHITWPCLSAGKQCCFPAKQRFARQRYVGQRDQR